MLLLSEQTSGLGLGSMYGLMALSVYMTYAVLGTTNFAQGSAMMLGAVLTYAFAQTLGWPMPAATLLALTLCALYGLLVERLAVQAAQKESTADAGRRSTGTRQGPPRPGYLSMRTTVGAGRPGAPL